MHTDRLTDRQTYICTQHIERHVHILSMVIHSNAINEQREVDLALVEWESRSHRLPTSFFCALPAVQKRKTVNAIAMQEQWKCFIALFVCVLSVLHDVPPLFIMSMHMYLCVVTLCSML